MRQVICSIGLLFSSVVLSACGQSGALQLPSDINHDKRATYLLYKNEAAQAKASSNVNTESQATQSQITSP